MEDAAHPNQVKAQETWDALARGELAGLDDQAEHIVVENGPGAGPWRVVEGKDAFVNFVLAFIPLSIHMSRRPRPARRSSSSG